MPLTPPLKWHGGKSYLANRIVALMPKHLHYVEPFGGGLAVLLAKGPEGISEVVNDLNGCLMNFWSVLQSPAFFSRFVRIVEAMPFSEGEYERACKSNFDGIGPTSKAVAFFVRCRQSLAGRMDSFAPLSRARTRRGMNEQASAWLGAVEGLKSVHARLKRVAILNQPAIAVIKRQDGPATLFYCDPPYLKSTRAAVEAYGDFEMSEQEHLELLAALKSIRGKAMLSGYASPMYEKALKGWTQHHFELPNNSAGGSSKRRMVEMVWCNF